MGFVRTLDRPGRLLRLDDHEGCVVPIRVDGSPLPAWMDRHQAETATAGWRAVCSCPWQGPVVDREEGMSVCKDFNDLPDLGNAWLRHTARAFAELAGHPTTVDYEPHPDGGRGWRPRCLGGGCTWAGDVHPTEDGARGGERTHHEAVVAPTEGLVRR